MTHVTCRLTAKNRDPLWNPTLGNPVWATFRLPFTFLLLHRALPLTDYVQRYAITHLSDESKCKLLMLSRPLTAAKLALQE